MSETRPAARKGSPSLKAFLKAGGQIARENGCVIALSNREIVPGDVVTIVAEAEANEARSHTTPEDDARTAAFVEQHGGRQFIQDEREAHAAVAILARMENIALDFETVPREPGGRVLVRYTKDGRRAVRQPANESRTLDPLHGRARLVSLWGGKGPAILIDLDRVTSAFWSRS